MALDFHAFTNFLSGTANRLEQIQFLEHQNKSKDTTVSTMLTTLGTQIHSQAPTPTANRTTKMTDEAREQLLKEGKCFYCKLLGHISRDCPTKKAKRTTGTTTQLKAMEPMNEATPGPVWGKEQA